MAEPKVECVLDARALIGESPVWCGRQHVLWWVDIKGRLVNRFDPSTGRNTAWDVPGPPGCLSLTEDGGVVLAMGDGFHRFDPSTGATSPLAVAEVDKPGNRMNDGRCDRAGRFWAGTMHDPPRPPQAEGTLYRLGLDGAVTAMVPDLIVSNGLAFSPDDKILYLSDSNVAVRTIWAFDFDLAEGRIDNRRVFVDTNGMPGRPDGAAVDADGCYWMAAADGWELVRFTPAGKIDRRIPVPVQKPSMPAFGGADLRTIYVTSIGDGVDRTNQPQAGGLFAVDAGVQGLPEPWFKG